VFPRLFLALTALLCASSATAQAPTPVNVAAISAARPPELLMAYHFFRDAGAREPNERVTPYDLNTALYSDGALKYRYVFIPPGQHATYNPDTVFEFPIGTVLIKTFAFAADMRHPDQNVRFLETRLLIHRADGWVALPYVWNAAQTEARLSPIGATVPIDFTDADGQAQHLDWAVPNRNQCKGCHDRAGELVPIGPSARNLNRIRLTSGVSPVTMEAMLPQQLPDWVARGILDQVPADAPRVPSAYDTRAPLEARARAYLDVNCAHCHNPQGPAHTSGLDLRWNQHDPVAWGVNKRPVAAGRGSANMQFAIAPGDPDHSFLLYRMHSLDPGEMMPELGRQTVDTRAVALIRDWIAQMNADGSERATP
jgi:uncharacterized repeat protein (TIGR03806 family)